MMALHDLSGRASLIALMNLCEDKHHTVLTLHSASLILSVHSNSGKQLSLEHNASPRSFTVVLVLHSMGCYRLYI